MNIPGYVPLELERQVSAELQPGEKVRWMATPKPRYFTGGSLATFLFGIPWTAFAIFWTAGASGFVLPDFRHGFGLFALFGVPFILVGVGLLSSPLRTYRKSLRTVYAVTDRRAIVIEGGRSTVIRSFAPDRLQDIYRRERRDGTGDVVIERRGRRDSDSNKHVEEFGFFHITKPRDVEQMLQALAEQAGEQGA